MQWHITFQVSCKREHVLFWDDWWSRGILDRTESHCTNAVLPGGSLRRKISQPALTAIHSGRNVLRNPSYRGSEHRTRGCSALEHGSWTCSKSRLSWRLEGKDREFSGRERARVSNNTQLPWEESRYNISQLSQRRLAKVRKIVCKFMRSPLWTPKRMRIVCSLLKCVFHNKYELYLSYFT